MKRRIQWIGFLSGIFFALLVNADDDQRFRPFILASLESTDFQQTVEATRDALLAADFEVLGEYSPYQKTFVENAHIIVVTNERLKKVSTLTHLGGFSASWRIAITQLDDQIQVAYPNPPYIAAAYRLQSDLTDIAAQLQDALGFKADFGVEKGLNAKQLFSYQYAIGMEEFDKPYNLAEFESHGDAIDTLEHNLQANVAGLSRVYRLDINNETAIFGVAIKGTSKDDKYIDDSFIMSILDDEDLKGTAYLPYEILVQGKRVYALHMRFRMGIYFPDTSMTGKRSYFTLQPSSSAIEQVFSKLVVH